MRSSYLSSAAYTGVLYPAPFPAGHQDEKVEFNRTQQQTAGSGQSWTSGNGTKKPMQMTVQIPMTASGTSRPAVQNELEKWERVLERTTRWYAGARYRKVSGVLSIDRSRWAVLTAVLAVKDPLWFLSDDDMRPRRYPFETVIGEYPYGLLQVIDGNAVLPVGGVTFTDSTLTFAGADGQTFTLRTTEATYDQSQ